MNSAGFFFAMSTRYAYTAVIRGGRRLRIAEVSAIEVLLPKQCGHCGETLPQKPGNVTTEGEPRRHQVTEGPPVKAHITGYQLPNVLCGHCGNATRAPLPDEVAGQFGPQLTPLIAYRYGHLCQKGGAAAQNRRARRLVRDLWGRGITWSTSCRLCLEVSGSSLGPAAVSVAAAVGRPAAAFVAAGVGRPAAVFVAAAVGRPAAVFVVAGVGRPAAVFVAAAVERPAAVSVAAAVGYPVAVSVAAAVGRPVAAFVAAGVGRPAAVSVAAAVGHPAAVSVAAAVGRPVAAFVAAAVGRSVAVSVAAAVGRPVAAFVAAAVGRPAAVSVAAGVGLPDAAFVAAAVGRSVAAFVAAAVGRPVASFVAAAVGCPAAVSVAAAVGRSVAAVHSSARLPGAEEHSVAVNAVVQHPASVEHAFPGPYPRREPVHSESAHSGVSAGPRSAEEGDRGFWLAPPAAGRTGPEPEEEGFVPPRAGSARWLGA